jgi:salicylate hydroxylase
VSTDGLRVAVVGGGIGGLTLAIALRRMGVEVEVFEQAPELGEIGAAVALSANATRLLQRLGVYHQLSVKAAEPTELQFRRWDSGELIWSHPVGQWYRERCGGPYYGIHRQDLQRALIDGVGPGVIRLGHKFVDVEEGPDGARLTFEGGETAFAHVVVGADGVHSPLRWRLTGGEARAVFSRDVGFRGMIPVERLPSLPDPGAIQFWVGPGGHLLHYAIEDGKIVNYLAVRDREEWTEPTWRAPAELPEAVAAFEGWHPAVAEMVGAEGEVDPAWWALHDYEPLRRWTAGRVVLIGDAAHAMLPHQGQGANQSIEDAVALAHLLTKARSDDFRQALHRYEALRKRRTRRVQRYSRFAARALHVPDGPQAERRDAGLATLAEDIAWIHDYDVEEALAAEGALSEPAGNTG